MIPQDLYLLRHTLKDDSPLPIPNVELLLKKKQLPLTFFTRRLFTSITLMVVIPFRWINKQLRD